MSLNNWDNARVQVERTKLSGKVLNHFAIFAIINELLKNAMLSLLPNASARQNVQRLRLLGARGIVYYKRQLQERLVTLRPKHKFLHNT